MSATPAISAEVAHEIAALRANDPKTVEVEIIQLKNARKFHDVRKAAKAADVAMANANAQLISFKSDLRQALHKAESEWTRNELSIYRGVFVQEMRKIDAVFANSEANFADSKLGFQARIDDLSQANNSATRRYLRGVARDAIELIEDRIKHHRRFQHFVQKDFLTSFDRRLLELSEGMSVEKSTADITARYSTVLAYLAQ